MYNTVKKYGRKYKGEKMLNKDVYELTNAQKSIWLTEQYLKGTSIGNISGIVSINEKIDISKFETSLKEFVRRNDSMRTRIFICDGTPKQYFNKYEDTQISINIHKVKTKREVNNLAKKLSSTPFKLLESNLFKFDLFIYPDGQGRINNLHSSHYW